MPRKSKKTKKACGSSTSTLKQPNKDELSWLAELPLDVKVHIIMYAARAAGRPVLGMAVNRLCRKTMLLQQPGLIKKASCLPSAVKSILTSDLKLRRLPLRLVVDSCNALLPSMSLRKAAMANMSLVRVTKLSLLRTLIHEADLKLFPLLQQLRVEGGFFNNANLSEFVDLQSVSWHCCCLKELTITGLAALSTVAVTNSVIESCLRIQNCMQLEDIDCEGCNMDRDGKLQIDSCSNLKSLNFSQCSLAGLTISECEQVNKLCLNSSDIDIGLHVSKFECLKHLECNNCSWLHDLRLPFSIVDVDCSYCEGLNSIKLQGYPALKQLFCAGCSNLEEVQISNCQQLKFLDCSNCTGMLILNVQCNEQLARVICRGCDSLNVIDFPTSLLSLELPACITLDQLLKITALGLRCLSMHNNVNWKELLPNYPSLAQLRLHSSYYSLETVVGSTKVILGKLTGTCSCDTCQQCKPGDGSDNDEDGMSE